RRSGRSSRPGRDRRALAGERSALLRRDLETPEVIRELLEPRLDAGVDAARRIAAVLAAFAGGDAGEDLDALAHGVDRVDVERPLLDRRDDIPSKHEIVDVRARDDDAFLSGRTRRAHAIEEAFDLLVDAADGLHVALLVHRARDRDVLADRQVAQARKDRVHLRGGGAVAVDPRIGLLEADARREAQRPLLREARAKVTAEDLDALVVAPPAESGFALDVEDSPLADRGLAGDARRLPEGVVAHVVDREPIH